MLQAMTQSQRLSLQQRRVWLQQRSGEAFHGQIALKIEGDLDSGRLREALRAIVRRHEILRTVFRRLPGMKVSTQSVLAELEPAWREVELGDDEIERFLGAERSAPFDLAAGPLLRATLARTGDKRHVLAVGLPALCADAKTLANLMRELAAAYAGEPLDEESLQYAQFTEWQSSLLDDRNEDTERGLAFWNRNQGRAEDLPNLPLTRGRTGRETAEAVPVSLVAKGSGDLLSATPEFSLERFLQAAWASFIWRLSGAPEVTLGTELHGRQYEAMDSAFGLYARVVPLHCHLRASLRFDEVVQHLELQMQETEQWLDFYEATPEPRQEDNRFPVGFHYEAVAAPIEAGGLIFSVHSQLCRTELFGLQLRVRHGTDLQLELEFDAGLYQRRDVEALAGRFARLIHHAVRKGSSQIGELELLSPEERHWTIFELNDTDSFGGAGSPSAALAELASLRPGNVALAIGEERWTLVDLEQRVDRLARRLRAAGVGPDCLVGVCLERSPVLLAALLAVLRAGGAYVPLDPSSPPARLRGILEDSGASVLLTREIYRDWRLEPEGLEVICLEGAQGEAAGPVDEGPFPVPGPDNLAYVIYTSGSTGRPKGVMVSRAGLEHYLAWAVRAYSSSAEVGSILHSPVAFDLAVTSLFVPLLGGKPLVLLPEENGIESLDAALGAGVDFLKLTPSQLQVLSGLLSAEALANVSALVIGGEELRGEILESLRRRSPRLRLINEYGPTETVVGCCVYEVPEGEPAAGPVPIGRPIANTRLYVLDGELRPVVAGVPGELFIGGMGLARGYLGAPALTASAFVPDPFDQMPGSRLYRTGDLARHLPDGTLEYLGRIDHQIKLRGFRIEPGEIEAQLAQHPGVRESVVVARETEPGRKEIVAYALARQSPIPDAELRSLLKAKLPPYMIPAAFVWLEALPRTRSGKLDRRALPAPERLTTARQRPEYVAPNNQAEEILVEIWNQVLNVERIGIHDNFLQLGGDSIMGIQVVARANQAGLRLTPRQVLEHPTVAELARVAGFDDPVRAEQGLVTGATPLTPNQHRFLANDPIDPDHFNQSLLFEVGLPLDSGLLYRSLVHLLRHHDALRLRFQYQPEGWVQEIAAPEDQVPFTRVDLSVIPPDERTACLMAAAAGLQGSLGLERGPVVRVAQFDLGPSESQRLLFIIHHMVIDGVSWRLVLEDLERCYEQLRSNQKVALPSKTSSFKEWALRLADFARWEVVEREAGYWLAESRANPGRLTPDFPGGIHTVRSERMVRVSLDPDATRVLLTEVPRTFNAEVDQVLLAALAHTLARATGSRRVLIDLEGHGREGLFEDLDLSRTLGWFTLNCPVLLDLGTAVGPGETLSTVREQIRKIPNRGVGYGLLRYMQNEGSEIARLLRQMPAAEVAFNYLGQLDRPLSDSWSFRVAREYTGNTRSPRGLGDHLLSVDGSLGNGRLEVSWTFSQDLFRRETVEALANDFVRYLQSMIEQGRALDTEALQPADFPQAEISPEDLARVLASFQSGDAGE
ncbi:MAG TPA: amino acid adenylation domain-containing protein [Thermoanaerobaculia bacterium]|jgi:amino acid adenylation domain-containing protein/non-ribosomal peptide synthase protein (TIGR01720 family)|nr:amino acid adenylation domain-containing protein [Thermoanaerobaculia bacterium]